MNWYEENLLLQVWQLIPFTQIHKISDGVVVEFVLGYKLIYFKYGKENHLF